MRKTIFANKEFYHVYNRGTDKRVIFCDQEDMNRFFQSMEEFNSFEPIGSIYEQSFLSKNRYTNKTSSKKKLVNFISYCVNPNHYHFLLEQIVDNGIEKFLHRLGTGYTMYFNNRYKRTGSLFQGRFKATHVNLNEYLLHVSVYINLNDKVHQLGGSTSKLVASKSSWDEYVKGEKGGWCEKDIILGQFNNTKEYEEFAKNSLVEIIERKKEEKEEKEIKDLLLE